MSKSVALTVSLGLLSTVFHRYGYTHGLVDILSSIQNLEQPKYPQDNLPDFQFFPNILSEEDREGIKDYVHNVGLAPDPTSKHFIDREKKIRFIKVESDGFSTLEKDNFIQPEVYNDFSGGYKRYYELLPLDLINGPMHNIISHYIQYHQIPIGTIFLVHLQSSILRANTTIGDVTGQGIHTDGSDDAMLVCIERENVTGAATEFHGALDGSQPLNTGRVLEAGDAVNFVDNRIFHRVSDAKTDAPFTRRTMIVMHSPEDGTGKINPRNNLGTNRATTQVRFQDEMEQNQY